MMWSVWKRLRRGFPVVNLVAGYGLDKAVSDLVAGITIGLTLIPQSLAYASLAGLDPQYGLYSSLVGGVVYLIFGTVAELNIAPTALLSLLTYTYTHDVSFPSANAAILLCFFAGIIQLLCGILQLGFLVDFVSTPVVAAFTSAGAITIATSQVKNLLGLKFKADSFTSVWKNVFEHINETKVFDAILGLICCFVLLGLRKLKDFGEPPLKKDETKVDISTARAKWRKFLWFLSVARNALVVLLPSVMVAVLRSNNLDLFSQTSTVETGLPTVDLPKFEMVNNGTTIAFTTIVMELGAGIFVIPFIAILANVAISKAFANGKVIDASQEMVAIGMCNVVGSFFGSYPINASFSRAAVSNASGVRTPVAGIYTSTMVILSLTFLTPYFSYIPKPTLSAVVICAVLFMIEVELTQVIWKTNKMDFIPFTVTLISCLFIGIEIGILVGVTVDVILLLYYNARPKVLIEKNMVENNQNNTHYIKVTPLATTLFPSAEYMRDKIMKECNLKMEDTYKYVVFDCYRMRKIDFTAAKCMSSLISDLSRMDKNVVFYRPKESLQKVIRRICKDDALYVETEAELLYILKERRERPSVCYTIPLSTMCNGKTVSGNNPDPANKDKDPTMIMNV